MSDIFGPARPDGEGDDGASTPAAKPADPLGRARELTRRNLPKRFYKNAGIAHDAAEEAYRIELDGKTVKTPSRKLLALPTEVAAGLVADEFQRQGEHITPMTMPVLRLANTAIDGVSGEMQAVAEDMLRFASSDLLVYRADGPERLVERQSEHWDPVLDWARSALGARFVLAEGVVFVTQPREAIGAISIWLHRIDDPFRLASLHSMTTLTGSALLPIAVAEGQLTAEEAWAAAHVDEDWNIEQWGDDPEAAARRLQRKLDMDAAAALFFAMDRSH